MSTSGKWIDMSHRRRLSSTVTPVLSALYKEKIGSFSKNLHKGFGIKGNISNVGLEIQAIFNMTRL